MNKKEYFTDLFNDLYATQQILDYCVPLMFEENTLLKAYLKDYPDENIKTFSRRNIEAFPMFAGIDANDEIIATAGCFYNLEKLKDTKPEIVNTKSIGCVRFANIKKS